MIFINPLPCYRDGIQILIQRERPHHATQQHLQRRLGKLQPNKTGLQITSQSNHRPVLRQREENQTEIFFSNFEGRAQGEEGTHHPLNQPLLLPQILENTVTFLILNPEPFFSPRPSPTWMQQHVENSPNSVGFNSSSRVV